LNRLKRNIIIAAVSIVVILTLIVVVGLNMSSKKSAFLNENTAYDSSRGESSSSEGCETPVAPTLAENKITNESKVITNVFMSMETTEFNSAINNLDSLVKKYNGYIENSNISTINYGSNGKIYKDGNYVIRIPQKEVNTFTVEVNKIGNVISQQTSKSDITMQYQDTESRLNVLKVKEERILELLKKAEKIDDVIKLENELSQVIYEKESLTRSLKGMDNQVDYSTVSVTITEVDKLSSSETVETKFGEKILNALNNSIYLLKQTIQKLIILIIYIIPFALIIAAIFFVIHKIFKKQKKD